MPTIQKKSTECLTDIIKNINDNTRFTNCKTGFYNFHKLDNTFLEFLAKITIENVKSKTEKAKIAPKSTKGNKNIMTVDSSTKRFEEMIERLIFLTNKDMFNIENQYPIHDKNQPSHIDILLKDKKTTYIIELKQWDRAAANPPSYAAIEALKNYFMYLKGEGKNDKNKIILTILAPQKYFKYSCQPNGNKHSKNEKYLKLWKNNWLKFFKYLRFIEENLDNKISFEIKYLDFSQETMIDFLNDIQKLTTTSQIDFEEYYLKSKTYTNKIQTSLLFTNWNTNDISEKNIDIVLNKII
ncbi:hypothetical protein IJ182_00205 [bacterium]|nr:hypothetical protein [bacterium]